MQESPPRIKDNLFFRLVIVAGVIFTATVLAMIVTALKPTGSPLQKFVDAHGIKLIVGEVIVTLVLGFLALAIDRRRQVAQMQREADATSSENNTDSMDA